MSLLKDSADSHGVLRTGRILLLPWQMVLLISVYVGVVLNGAVFVRRLSELGKLAVPTASGALITLLAELGLVFAFTALLLSLADLSGRWVSRTVMALFLTISVLASYYMTFFNVVIGYGVVQAVLTTDVDLSKEAVGVGLLLWFL
ncbi:MAG: phosphoethanolamine transferase domain-containing protein, partial [Burkholderiaceae bacterium]|nr:phosphoethanolamine transferase domain-containing protein [Burkholderiaceae bacterium]